MEQFPEVEEEEEQRAPPPVATEASSSSPKPPPPRRRTATTSAASGRIRGASLKFLESNPPNGMWQATGEIASRVPTLNEIRTGGFSNDGWTEEGQMERRGNTAHDIQRRKLSRVNSNAMRAAAANTPSPTPITPMETYEEDKGVPGPRTVKDAEASASEPTKDGQETVPTSSETKTAADTPGSTTAGPPPIVPDETGMYPNGYRFPPKHTWKESTIIGLKAFGGFILTPFGFIVTIYGLNVVAWGAMIFFVLLNAAPAMCHPSCDADESPRQKWIEIDAQILNALFCVTGFGLIPWRFRDLYFLLRWRLLKSHDDLRKLAGVHRGWFRLPDSDKLPDYIGPPPIYEEGAVLPKNARPPYTATELEELENNPAIPLPLSSIPAAPLTGVRAKPTKLWYLDLVVWLYVWNTFFQICLSGCMWGMNRFTRPPWTTGLFVCLACLVAIIAGLTVFLQGKAVKNVEGIPVDEDLDGSDDAEKQGLTTSNGDVQRTGTSDTMTVSPGIKRSKTTESEWFKR